MVVGQVARAFGVHGEMRIESRTDFPERFELLDRIYLGPDRLPYTIEKARRSGENVFLKLEGVDSPEKVRELGRPEIAIPRSQAMPLPEGHFYLDDLVGMEVSVPEGGTIGQVSDVVRTGSNDVCVVNGGRASILIPLIRDAIRHIDVQGGRLVVEPWVLENSE
jgi:16S rRNA processing protein RimM